MCVSGDQVLFRNGVAWLVEMAQLRHVWAPGVWSGIQARVGIRVG